MKNFLFVLLLVGITSSCDDRQGPRTYQEITTESRPVTVANPQMPTKASDQERVSSSGDPHAGFTREQLVAMLEGEGRVSSGNPGVRWTVPQGWSEQPASGMRLATLIDAADPNAIDCSVVTLGKGAGGIEGNIVRWLGQIDTPELTSQQVEQFIRSLAQETVRSGQTAAIVDFTTLQAGMSDSSISTIAAIIDGADQRVFIKMMGTKANVLNHRDSFLSLLRSLQVE